MTSRWERLGRYFPLPLVSVAVLLVILIFITPNFASPGGTLATQAQLVVDRFSGSNQTFLYLEAIGTARYAFASVAVATNAVWPASVPPAVAYNFSNATSLNNTLGLNVATPANPFAVNVSAIYRDTSGDCVEYLGTYVFNYVGPSQTLEYMDVTPSGPGSAQSAPLSSLPLPILLNSVALGAC